MMYTLVLYDRKGERYEESQHSSVKDALDHGYAYVRNRYPRAFHLFPTGTKEGLAVGRSWDCDNYSMDHLLMIFEEKMKEIASDPRNKLQIVTRGEYKGRRVRPIRPDWAAGMMVCELETGGTVSIAYDGYKDA